MSSKKLPRSSKGFIASGPERSTFHLEQPKVGKTIPKESNVQAAILEYLKANTYTYWRSYVGPIVQGGGKTRKRFMKNPMAGYPDITGFLLTRPNQMWVMEVKTEIGKLSTIQEDWLKLLAQHGIICMVPRSIEMAIRLLSESEEEAKIKPI